MSRLLIIVVIVDYCCCCRASTVTYYCQCICHWLLYVRHTAAAQIAWINYP